MELNTSEARRADAGEDRPERDRAPAEDRHKRDALRAALADLVDTVVGALLIEDPDLDELYAELDGPALRAALALLTPPDEQAEKAEAEQRLGVSSPVYSVDEFGEPAA